MDTLRVGTSELSENIDSYHKRCGLFRKNRPWEVRISPSGGYGLFSNRNIEVGEVLFKDKPIIIGPRFCDESNIFCALCFNKKTISICNKCNLNICDKCDHRKICNFLISFPKKEHVTISKKYSMSTALIYFRSLMLNNDEKSLLSGLKAYEINDEECEIDILKNILGFIFTKDEETYLKFICALLLTNSFQIVVNEESKEPMGRGLYPLASLANHSCIPNISHVFDENQLMIARAAVFIPKDAELFHSYTRVTWGTSTRLYHLLKTKHFICKCERCLDPTEFGTYMNSVLCKSCKGKIVPVNPLKPKGKWQCEDCKQLTQGKEVEHLLTLLSSVLKGFSENTDLEIMVKYLNGKLRFMAPPNSQVAIEVKLKIIWMLGYDEKYKWHCLNTDQLILKKNLCIDIIELLEKLKTGQCKMRGLLLYELFCTEKELSKKDLKEQNNNITNMQIAKTYLEEASNILLYDVTAPQEIKEKWKTIL